MPPTDSEEEDDDEFRVHSLNVKQTHSYLDVYNSDDDEDANYCEEEEEEIGDGDDDEKESEDAVEDAAEEASEDADECADKPTASFVCWRKTFLLMKRWNNGQESSSSPYGHCSHGLQRSSSAYNCLICIIAKDVDRVSSQQWRQRLFETIVGQAIVP